MASRRVQGDGQSSPRRGVVKTEYRALHAIHSANWVEEEEERGTRWYAFLTELAASEGVGYGVPAAGCGDAEADAALLERAMSHYEACASRSSSPGDVAGTPAGGAPCAAGAACARRLRALVQAGVPMSHRGAFWKLFLGVASKRQPGEYDALVAKAFDGVAEPDARGDGGAASPAAPAASAWAAVSKGAKPYHMSMPCYAGGPPVVEIVADARGVLPPQCDIFQLIPLLDSPDKGAALAAGAEGPPATPGALPAAKPLPDECCRTPASSLVPPTCSSGRPTASPGSAWSPEAWQASDYLGQIEKDLHRTFPNHPSMDAAGRAMLRRILAAFARRSPRVGYCQGLNFIAAAFALFMEEEDAFWCLAAVVEDLLPGYFETRMVAPQVDQLVLAHLLQGGFPTVWRHLQSLDVDPTSATLHWYLCLFLNSLPLETCLRVWDVLFFEGSPVVLFRVALALVETYSQALLATRESSDVFMLLQARAALLLRGLLLASLARGEVLQAMRVSVTSEEEFRELCEHHEDPGSTLHSARTCGMRCGEAWQAFEIAARVSPTVAQSSAARERQLSGGRLPGHAVAEAAASGAGAAGCALPGQARTAAEDYPVRALQFELCGVELDACQPGTAPAAVGGPAADNSPFADEAWAARRYTEGDATEGMLHQTPGPAAPAEQRVQEPRLQGAVAAGGSGPQECRLLDVLAQLQEALAVGESRRHEAEHAASEARDMLQALEGQLAKVLTGVERKVRLRADEEAAAAELRSALAAAAPALAELEGELTAKRMAVEDGLRRLELKELQLASQEALACTKKSDTPTQLVEPPPAAARVGNPAAMRCLAVSLLMALALGACPRAGAESWRACSSEGSVQVQSANVSPNPIPPGGSTRFQLEAVALAGVPGGRLTATVKYLGFKVFKKAGDLCDAVACPLAPGPATLTLVEHMPGLAPPGSYSIQLEAAAAEPGQGALFCVEIDFRVASKAGKSAWRMLPFGGGSTES
eukprot:scaffold14.g1132.t1